VTPNLYPNMHLNIQITGDSYDDLLDAAVDTLHRFLGDGISPNTVTLQGPGLSIAATDDAEHVKAAEAANALGCPPPPYRAFTAWFRTGILADGGPHPQSLRQRLHTSLTEGQDMGDLTGLPDQIK
jgi:hypothetical protein